MKIIATLLCLCSFNLFAGESSAILTVSARVLPVGSPSLQIESAEVVQNFNSNSTEEVMTFNLQIKKTNVKAPPRILATLSGNGHDQYVINGQLLTADSAVSLNLNETIELRVIHSSDSTEKDEGRVVLETLY